MATDQTKTATVKVQNGHTAKQPKKIGHIKSEVKCTLSLNKC